MRCGYEWVVARPGWMHKADGTCERDGSPKGGPEWGPRKYRYAFASHRAAARVANKCGQHARIVEEA